MSNSATEIANLLYGYAELMDAFSSSDEKWRLALEGKNLTDDGEYLQRRAFLAGWRLYPRTHLGTFCAIHPLEGRCDTGLRAGNIIPD